MEDINGFLKVVPPGLCLLPLFFGLLYAVLMGVILQRGAARRRKQREAKLAIIGGGSGAAPSTNPTPAPKPRRQAAIPEPDMDLLVISPSVSAASALVPRPAVSMQSAEPAIPEPDWMSAFGTEPAQIVEIDPMPTMPSPDMQPNSTNTSAAPADAVEVMRVWRDLSDGTLIVQMGDKRYRSMGELTNSPDLVRRFSAVVRELYSMVNGGARPTTLPAPDMPALPDMPGGGMKARIGMLKDQGADESLVKPGGVLRQLGRAATGQSSLQPKGDIVSSGGIADMVEEFLQYKLTNHPQFGKRSIHIRPAIDGGVRIEVDGNSYQGIGDVVDPDAREFLFSVMKEWEARQ